VGQIVPSAFARQQFQTEFCASILQHRGFALLTIAQNVKLLLTMNPFFGEHEHPATMHVSNAMSVEIIGQQKQVFI